MAVRKNADGSITVGIIPEEKPEEKKPSPPDVKKQSKKKTEK